MPLAAVTGRSNIMDSPPPGYIYIFIFFLFSINVFLKYLPHYRLSSTRLYLYFYLYFFFFQIVLKSHLYLSIILEIISF